MKNLIKAGRAFYGVGIAGLGIQQFIYKDFRPVIMPQWASPIPGIAIWAYITGAALVIAGAIIVLSKNARLTSLILGLAFLLFFIAFHVTFQLFFSPYDFHLGSWTDPLKELAFSGGAFVIAGSYAKDALYGGESSFSRFADKFIPLGKIFFCITMIVFGIDHFIYTEFVATLVPSWIPGHVFWTYFAGVALAASGVAIILNIKRSLVAFLLGIMLFLWLIVLHIPRAVADPYGTKGNEITSVFEALAFSGIAFVIASMAKWRYKRSNR